MESPEAWTLVPGTEEAQRPRTASLLQATGDPENGSASSPSEEEEDVVVPDEFDDLRCLMCKDIFRNPVQLRCGHHLCRLCGETLYSFAVLQSFEMCSTNVDVAEKGDPEESGSGSAYVESIACLSCHRLTALEAKVGVASLPDDEKLAAACDRVREEKLKQLCGWCTQEAAAEECSKCEVLFCAKCKEETHVRRPAFAKHRFYPIGALAQQRFQICKKHKGRRKDIFCRDCGRSLCLYCVKLDKTHNSHKLISLPDGVTELTAQLDVSLTQMEYHLRELDTYRDAIQASGRHVTEGYAEMEASVRAAFDEARQKLAEREAQFIDFAHRRLAEDTDLGNALLMALEHVSRHARKVISAKPSEVQDPEVLLTYMKELTALGKNLDDVQMESSLSVGQFEFNLPTFEAELLRATRVREKLTVNQVTSDCISSPAQEKALVSFLATQVHGHKQVDLVYKASQLGWSDRTFQARIASLSEPSFFLCKTVAGRVFGGFRSVPWDGSNSVEGPGAFLFSLGDEERKPILLENTYRSNMTVAEMTAKNRDLQIFLDRQAVLAHLGQTFAVPSHLQDQTQELLVGGITAKLAEFEVYSIGNVHHGGPKQHAILRGHLEWKKQLTAWIGQSYHMHNLLYKASKDGWFDEVFHEKCDNKGPTLVIAKAEGHIFGGFTKASWGGMNITYKGFVFDESAFIFSVTDGHGRPPKKLDLVHAKFAIQNDFKAGPNFGAGNDLRLELKEQLVRCCPHSYKVPNGFRADHFVCGATSARLDEVEVYYIPIE